MDKIFFINGVNTHFGGSGASALRYWFSSFDKNHISYDTFETVPTFNFTTNNFLYKIVLFLFFLPGSFFRFTKLPIIEILYKLSFFNFIKLLYESFFKHYSYVIFSHHASFYLYFLFEKKKRIFICHDLLYFRAKKMGYSRKIQKIIFFLETELYKQSILILSLSYREAKILKKFTNRKVELISCYDIGSTIYSDHSCDLYEYAVVSDWRRKENLHGLIDFFSKNEFTSNINIKFKFYIYGFGSENAIQEVTKINKSNFVQFIYKGSFKSPNDIYERFYFVPIYQGAGIKLKTLEGIHYGKTVVGTREAFIGIPPWILNQATIKINTLSDLLYLKGCASFNEIDLFRKNFNFYFADIGEILTNKMTGSDGNV